MEDFKTKWKDYLIAFLVVVILILALFLTHNILNKVTCDICDTTKLTNANSKLNNEVTTLNKKLDEYLKKIETLEKEKVGLEEKVSSLNKTNSSSGATQKRLNSKITELTNEIGELKKQVEELQLQITNLTNKIKELEETYSVIYIDGTTEVYRETVSKGNNVQNVPAVPSKNGYNGYWTSEGKNIQKDTVIISTYVKAYTITLDVTSNFAFDNGNPIATLNSYSLVVDEGAVLEFTNKTISVNGKTLVTATLSDAISSLPVYFGWALQPSDDYYGNGTNTYEVTEDATFKFTTISLGCVLKGTKVTMSNGSLKNIEDLEPNDMVMTYDFLEGKMVARKLLSTFTGTQNNTKIINVNLDTGKTIKIYMHENFFDMDSREYFEVSLSNYKDIVGKNIMIYDNGARGSAKIISTSLTTEDAEFYTLYTDISNNYIANGALMSYVSEYDNLIYKVNSDYKIDMDLLNKDIQKYGLYSYDDLKSVVTLEEYNSFNIKYMKILVGKGYITYEEVLDGLQSFVIEYRDAYNKFNNR